jgi:hypothetical protein
MLPDSAAPARRRQPTPMWEVSDHACRFCLGRVLVRAGRGAPAEVRCAQCGAKADGGPSALCCCGADCGALGYALECFKNPNVTNEVPHEIMVREPGAPAPTPPPPLFGSQPKKKR